MYLWLNEWIKGIVQQNNLSVLILKWSSLQRLTHTQMLKDVLAWPSNRHLIKQRCKSYVSTSPPPQLSTFLQLSCLSPLFPFPSLSLSLSLSISLSLSPPFCPQGWEGTSRIRSRWCSTAAAACNILTTGLMGRDARMLQGFMPQLRN